MLDTTHPLPLIHLKPHEETIIIRDPLTSYQKQFHAGPKTWHFWSSTRRRCSHGRLFVGFLEWYEESVRSVTIKTRGLCFLQEKTKRGLQCDERFQKLNTTMICLWFHFYTSDLSTTVDCLLFLNVMLVNVYINKTDRQRLGLTDNICRKKEFSDWRYTSCKTENNVLWGGRSSAVGGQRSRQIYL